MRWHNKPVARPSFVAIALSAEHGRAWYVDSGASIASYADARGLQPQYVADVVAILSPRVSVARNVTLARRYLETGACPGAMTQRLRALARYETAGVFNGPKVNAFSAALQGDPDAVVIDAWMARLFNMPPGLTPKRYRTLASKVRGVATRLGWSPAETQAALWVGARGLCGFTDDYSPLEMGGGRWS